LYPGYGSAGAVDFGYYPRRRGWMATGLNRNAGMLVLAIWLILSGLSGLFGLGLPAIVMSVLALIAGILILVGR
jgi:hypothetical protein